MALEIEQVSEIVNRYAETTKAWENKRKQAPYNPITKEKENVTEYPEYWVGYNYAAKMYDSIMPHVNGAYYPAHLFAKRAPNETKEQSEYIKANYRPITTPVFEDFKSTITRAFADQNWHIKYLEETEPRFGYETLENYLNNWIDNFGSLEMFVKSLLPTLKLSDANGVIAVYPEKLPTEIMEDGEVMTNELVEPQPFFYSCKRVVGKENEVYYLILTQYNSKVKDGSKYVNSGQVLFLFDNENIWKIQQKGKKIDFEFGEPELHYQHNLGYTPVISMMGTPMLIDNSIVYQSPFLTSVALLDQVLLDNSYLGMVKATSAFPFMVALGDTCSFVNSEGSVCNDGQIEFGGKFSNCPSCGGAGLKSRFSPSGKLLIRPKTTFSEGDTGLSGDYLKFVSPPMDTLRFLREEIDSHLLKARQVIHINNSDQAVQGNEAQTATGSLAKMRSMYAFIKPISDQMFTIWEFMIETIGKMRYNEYYGGVSMVFPTTFDITTPSDYLAIISEGIEAGVPPSVTYMNVYNYIRAINYTDAQTTALYELILNADELLLMGNADIALRVANGTVEKWQDVLHNSAPQLVMELEREYVPTADAPTFFDLELQEQIDLLRAKAVSKVTETFDPIQQARQDLINGFN